MTTGCLRRWRIPRTTVGALAAARAVTRDAAWLTAVDRVSGYVALARSRLFLASPQASYISGATLVLHGGGEPPAFLAAARGM